MSFTPERKDLDELKLDPTKCYSFITIGSTRSGKSTLINYILNKWMQNKINVLFTESPNADAYQEEGYKKHCVMCPSYEPSIINDLYRLNKATNNHYMFNVILDDVCTAKQSPELKKLLTVMRNSQIGCIISGQGCTMLPPVARSNVNIVLLGRVNNDAEAENIVKFFLTSFFPSDMKMIDKIKAYRDLTKNHNWICLDNLSDNVFITKLKI